MSNKIEVEEKCNLKTGENQWFIGDEVVHIEYLSAKEILEKFKDQLTKEQKQKLKKFYKIYKT